ncbi:hypothetical protein BPC006_II2688 [Burkholderia pseudomallei BPC006]|nr:hypothetical protein BPC006_II2688 [Burkholderia pseudomallei BPC006]
MLRPIPRHRVAFRAARRSLTAASRAGPGRQSRHARLA